MAPTVLGFAAAASPSLRCYAPKTDRGDHACPRRSPRARFGQVRRQPDYGGPGFTNVLTAITGAWLDRITTGANLTVGGSLALGVQS